MAVQFWQPECFPLPGDAYRRETGRRELVVVLAVLRRRNAPRVLIADVSDAGVEFKDISIRLFAQQVDNAEAESLALEDMRLRALEDELVLEREGQPLQRWPVSVPARLVPLVGESVALADRPDFAALDAEDRARHLQRRTTHTMR